MKTLLLALLVASAVVARADGNLLQNGDFSSGIEHWDGDCHTPDNDAADMGSTAAPAAGVVIKLRGGDWTKVSQDFDGQVGSYLLTITYSVSPDLKFSDRQEDYLNIPDKAGFSRMHLFNSLPGQWLILLRDLGAKHRTTWQITPKLGASDSQTITKNVTLRSDDVEKKGFFLLFPPGDGIITLQKVTLVAQ